MTEFGPTSVLGRSMIGAAFGMAHGTVECPKPAAHVRPARSAPCRPVTAMSHFDGAFLVGAAVALLHAVIREGRRSSSVPLPSMEVSAGPRRAAGSRRLAPR